MKPHVGAVMMLLAAASGAIAGAQTAPPSRRYNEEYGYKGTPDDRNRRAEKDAEALRKAEAKRSMKAQKRRDRA